MFVQPQLHGNNFISIFSCLEASVTHRDQSMTRISFGTSTAGCSVKSGPSCRVECLCRTMDDRKGRNSKSPWPMDDMKRRNTANSSPISLYHPLRTPGHLA